MLNCPVCKARIDLGSPWVAECTTCWAFKIELKPGTLFVRRLQVDGREVPEASGARGDKLYHKLLQCARNKFDPSQELGTGD